MDFDRPHLADEDVLAAAGLFERSTPTGMRDISGNPNQTLVLTFADRPPLALRVCNNGYTSPAHLRLEVDVLRHLESAGFSHAPTLVAGLNGRDIQHWGRYRVIAMTALPGRPPTTDSISPHFCRQLGAVLARLTSALAVFAGRPPATEAFHARSLLQATGLEKNARTTGWTGEFGWIVDAWRDADAVLLDLADANSLIHADIWPPNVLQSGPDLIAIVDFDDMAIGPPVVDLVSALSEFAMFRPDLHINEPNARALLTAYRQVRPISAREWDAARATMIALYASWVSQDALHGVPYDDTAVYVERLKLLVDPRTAATLQRELYRLFATTS